MTMKRVQVSLDDNVWLGIRNQARLENLSVSSFMRRLLREKYVSNVDEVNVAGANAIGKND